MSTQGYNRGQELLNALGTFWTRLFQQREFIQGFTEGVEIDIDQEYFNFLERVLATSIHDIPVFHRDKWRLLTFLESEIADRDDIGFTYSPEAFVYGEQDTDTPYEPGKEYVYGGFYRNQVWALPLPTGVVDVQSYLSNRLINPSLVLTKNADFIVYDTKYLILNSNPFENSKIPSRIIYDTDGNVADREIALWALNSDEDQQFLYNYYGSVVGITGDSSQAYKDMLRTIWAYFTQGATIDLVLSAANVVLGFPVARDNETVEDIRQVTTGELMITTDTNSYVLPGELSDTSLLNPTVFVGSNLVAFQPLLNIVEVKDTFGSKRWWRNLPFAIFPKAILGPAYYSSLQVPNSSTVIPSQYGATAALKMKAETTDEVQDYIQNFHNKYGMPAKYGVNQFTGSGSYEIRLNELDYMMESFFKNHLFYLHATLNKYHRISKAAANAFFAGLPAHVFPMTLFEYQLDTEEYPGNLCEHVFYEGRARDVSYACATYRHPVYQNLPRHYRFIDEDCDMLIHFSETTPADTPCPAIPGEAIPDCLPSRGVRYYKGDSNYQTELIDTSRVNDDTYFFNTETSVWYQYDTGTSSWTEVTGCISPEDIFGAIDVALDIGYGPYLPGNPDQFQKLTILNCTGVEDASLAEDPALDTDGRYRTETVIGNSTGTDDYAGMADGYLGTARYGNGRSIYGLPPIGTGAVYGRSIWQCVVDVSRVPSSCAKGGVDRSATRLDCVES